MNKTDDTLLRVTDLRTYFHTDDGVVKAVDGVSFRIPAGRTFALVGESGCGKSVTAFSILRLLSMPPAEIVSGRIELEGQEVINVVPGGQAGRGAGADPREIERRMRDIRGSKISIIFQEPMSSLNPVFTCGSQIVEAIQLHRPTSGSQAAQQAVEMLAKVGIPEPAQRFKEYPHQLSGGMRQRVMIAMALSCNPRLLIADEPTTALDVTIQAQILDLLRQLQAQVGLSILLITHDLAVVAETAHVVAVMYASKIVELADVQTLFDRPLHPYTHGLFRSLPRMGQDKTRLEAIGGNVPNPLYFPSGCKFHPRCELSRRTAAGLPPEQTRPVKADGQTFRVAGRCVEAEPPLREVEQGHWCRCWFCPSFDQAPETDPSL